MKITGAALYTDDLHQFLQQSYIGPLQDVGKYKIDKELSTSTVQVYSSPKQIVVVSRGTFSLFDWYTNYNLFMNKDFSSDRIRKSLNIVDTIKAKYPGIPITSVGHSLGGLLASKRPTDIYESIVANSYVPATDILKTVSDNEYLIRSSLDIPSALSKTQRRRNVITIPAQSKNLLTEHSYDIIKRLGNVLVGRTN